MRLIFSSIAAIALISFPVLVAAQNTSGQPDNSPSFKPPSRIPRNTRPSTEPAKPPEQYENKIADIKDSIGGSNEVKAMCAEYMNDIEYQFDNDKLRIDAGNNSCAFSIIKEVIQPQLAEGKIRTYEYTGDREGVVVTF